MYSVTLQTTDNIVTSGERIGQIQFAASNESDGSAAISVAGSVYCQAEGSFQSASNPTSLVLATAAADASAAVGRIKVTDNGSILPMSDAAYDLGNSNLQFKNQYISEGVVLSSNTPSSTTNKLYNEGGTLKFNGSAITGGGGGLSNIVEDTSPQLGAYLDAQNHNVSGVGSLEVTKAVFTPITTTTFASPTTTFDLDESNLFYLTLNGSIALAVSNGEIGQRFTLKLTQGVTGGRSVTWWGGISWPGGLIPTLSPDAGDSDLFGFIKTGASSYDGFVIGYSL